MQFDELSAASPGDYQGLTNRALRHLLDLAPTVRFPDEGDRRPVQPVAIGARERETAVGLALGCVPLAAGDRPELLSLYVLPDADRDGLKEHLLAEFEEAVRRRGYSELGFVYVTGRPDHADLEALLARRRWSAPETRMVTLRFTLEEAKSTPWYRRYRQRSGFDFFPWVELADHELTELRRSQEQKAWIAEDLVPWGFDHRRLEPASSIGIRLGGEIVGWVLNHQLGESTVRFTCSFVRRDLSRRGRIVPAYTESIDRAVAAGLERGVFTVPTHHREMVAFVQRWCAPWFGYVGETRGVAKWLTPEAAAGGQPRESRPSANDTPLAGREKELENVSGSP